VWHQFARSDWITDRSHLDDTGVGPCGAEFWLPVEQVQPAVSDPLFSRIAELADVPVENRERLQQCISLELEREWRYHENPAVRDPWYLQIAPAERFFSENRVRDDERGTPQTMAKKLQSARRQIEQLNRLSTELSACLSGLNFYALGSLMHASRLIDMDADDDPRKPVLGGHDFLKIKDVVATLDERASKAVGLFPHQKTKRPVGRPNRGGFSDPEGPGSFKLFVLRFLWDVGAVGGGLTIDKNHQKGTLVDALRLLSPHLPSGFIPNALPFSTLSDLNALAKKLAAALKITNMPNWPSLADRSH
jgi:hypothetical protein